MIYLSIKIIHFSITNLSVNIYYTHTKESNKIIKKEKEKCSYRRE